MVNIGNLREQAEKILINSIDTDILDMEYVDLKIEIISYCIYFGFKYKFVNDQVIVNSILDEWYFKYTSNENIKLFHKNSRRNINKYHLQGKFKDIYSSLSYIKKHDDFFYMPNDKHKFNIVERKLKG